MLWYKKYRPLELDKLSLSYENRFFFENVISTGCMGDFLFYSPGSGLGKTSLAKMLPDLMNKEILFINASKDGNIDTIKNDMIRFASFASIDTTGKIIVLDEAERLTIAAQQSLRGIIEDERYKDVNYIFTINDKSALIGALAKSRLVPIDFTLPKFDKEDKEFVKSVFVPIFNYLKYILDSEKIEYNLKDIPRFIHNEYPDIRQMVQKLQFSIFNNKLNLNKINSIENIILGETFYNLIKNKNKNKIYNFVNKIFKDKENTVIIIDYLYNRITELYSGDSFYSAIHLLNKYQINEKKDLVYPKINFLDFSYKMINL